MKNALIIFFLFLSYNVVAQTRPTGVPTQFSTGWFRWGFAQSDSGLIIGRRDTTFLPRFTGTIVMRPQDRKFYYYDSTDLRWYNFGTSIDTTSLSNRINLKLNIADTTNKWWGIGKRWVDSMYRVNDSTIGFTINNGSQQTFQILGRSASGGGSGTVTSVGLSMPSAFSVSGSPITSSGTFSVSGAGTTAQYIRGNGTLATFDTGAIPNFYLKVRGLLSGTSPITFNQTTGIIGINNANTSGTKGAATFSAAFQDNGSGTIDLLTLGAAGSCTGCLLNIDAKGRITAYSDGPGGATNNVNIGAGLRWLNGITQELRTVANSPTITWDSVSTANTLTAKADTSVLATQYDISQFETITANNGLTKTAGNIQFGGVFTHATKISGGASAYAFQIDSSASISLFSGLEYVSSGVGSFIQMSDSVMNIGASSTTDFTSITFSPTRIKFLAADGAGSVGDVWTNTGSGYGHWAAGGGGGGGATLNNIGTGFAWAATPGGNIKRAANSNTILWDSTSTANSLTPKVDTSVLATQYDLTNVVKSRYSITKGAGDSLQLLNDVSIPDLKRNYSYGPLNDSVRGWHPSYWSFIDKYYADTATETQTNVGGSSTVHLSNGTWLTAYTGFGTDPEDGGSSTIYAINSADNLRSFYNKRQIVALDTVQAHFGPSLYVKGSNLSTGDTVILIWATQINSADFNYVGDIRSRVSNDGGATWGAITILRAASSEYYNNFPNRIFRTNSGKLLYPFDLLSPGSISPGGSGVGWKERYLVSTNNGTTWTYNTSIPNAPDSGAIESGFYQRTGETRLYWYARSRRKPYVYTSYSDDDGVTWVTPNYMNFSNPDAAITIKYISSLDCFIGFGNRVNGATQPERRKYLNGFISYYGNTFKQFMTLDTAYEGSAGVIGLSDIIDMDSAIVTIYSSFTLTPVRGSMKVARIPHDHINSSFENTGSGITIPSGGDADRIANYIPNLRWNTTGYYEGSMGTIFDYGPLLQTGNLADPVYPYKTLTLKSYNQSGSFNLLNQDNNYNINRIELTKLFINNGNLGEGTTVGTYGFNTLSSWRGISSANTTGGYSTIDHTWWSYNAAGTNAERMRLTAEGRLGIATDVPAFTLDVNGKAAVRTMDSTASPANMIWRNPNTKEFELAAVPSIGNTIYTGDGTLPTDRNIASGGFTLRLSGANNSDTLMSIVNTGTSSTGLYSFGSLFGVDAQGTTIGLRAFGSATGMTAEGGTNEGAVIKSDAIRGATIQSVPATTNTIQEVLRLERGVNGSPGANGIGGSMTFYNKRTDNTSDLSNSIVSKFTDAVAATLTSQLYITGVNSGTPATILTLDGDGSLTTTGKRSLAVTTSSAGTLTLGNSEAYIFNGTTTTWTLAPVSGTTGRIYYIKNIGSGSITLNADSGNNEIYSSSAVNTITVTAGSAIILISNNTYWTVN